jgi:hypothetical protein
MYLQDWAAGLNAIGLFNNEAVPDPYRFDNWQDWAAATLNSVNLPPTGNN